jgi:ribosomal protein L37AE/L43A
MCTDTCCDPSSIKASIYKCPECGTDILVGIKQCIACGYVNDGAAAVVSKTSTDSVSSPEAA